MQKSSEWLSSYLVIAQQPQPRQKDEKKFFLWVEVDFRAKRFPLTVAGWYCENKVLNEVVKNTGKKHIRVEAEKSEV